MPKRQLKKQLLETMAKVRNGKTSTSRTNAAERLATLTRGINPQKVDETTLTELVYLLDTQEDSVRAWVAASLGNLDPRAKVAVPKLRHDLAMARLAHYPNELPGLKLYETAKWKSIVFNVSSKRDVENLLGKPVPAMIEKLGWLAGFDYDPDWTIVVFYFDGGNGCPKCLIGRVTEIGLWPKRRVPLKNATFSTAFEKSGLVDVNGVKFSIYRDKFGLLYSVYDDDSQDGQIHAGDLNQISYSDGDTNDQNPASRECL